MIKVEPGFALAELTADGSNCAKNVFWKPLLLAVRL